MTAHETVLADLSAHLKQRRDAILETWRLIVKTDPALTTGRTLTKSQLNGHLPGLLETFEQRLNPALRIADSVVSATQREQAAGHGLHRRQQGYNPREVCRELGRLNECMVGEIDNYAMTRVGFDANAVAQARRTWAELCSISISESIAQYFRLQQLEAAGYLWDLDTALEKIRELEKQRADLWHQAVHDIRGNLGVVVSATTALNMQLPDPVRSKALRTLDRNVTSLHQLLEDVMNLARLHADKEEKVLASVDVAALMRELCEGLQHQADQRGLSLVYEGPQSMVVQGDAVKIRRIAQNLALNAIKYTETGGIKVGLRDDLRGNSDHWMLWVQDTGPGLTSASGAPQGGAVEEAVKMALEIAADAQTRDATWGGMPPQPPTQANPATRPRSQQGEGIGLSIVKRLAALLNAMVDVDSRPGKGTTFRVLFPRNYPS